MREAHGEILRMVEQCRLRWDDPGSQHSTALYFGPGTQKPEAVAGQPARPQLLGDQAPGRGDFLDRPAASACFTDSQPE